MKKMLSKILSAALACSVALSASVCAFAASEKKYDKYVCLGDSNATGYATTDYVISCVPTKDAYHSKVAKALDADLDLYAWCGARSCELRYLFDSSYQFDSFYADVSYELKNVVDMRKATLDSARQNAIASVKDADLITIQVGANDFFTAPFKMYNYTGELTGPDRDTVNNFKAIDKALGDSGKLGFVLYMAYFFTTTIADYEENWDAIIKSVRELNPTADIVAISLNNPFNSMTLTTDSEIQIGKLAELCTAGINNYIKTVSPYASKYYFCDVTDIPLSEGVAALDSEFESKIMKPCHPNDDEHTIITRRILETIGADTSDPSLYPATSEDTSSKEAKVINSILDTTVKKACSVLNKLWRK